jgi:hypothetical protein
MSGKIKVFQAGKVEQMVTVVNTNVLSAVASGRLNGRIITIIRVL